MFYANTIIPVIFHVIFFVTGVIGSLFILSVQFLDWLKTHQLGPVDLIIVSIGFVNLLLQGSFAFNEICSFLFVEFYVQVQIVNSLAVIMTSLTFTSLWFSTTLCFYYYVKIINLKGTIFYKLKAKLPVIVPCLLIFSIVVSCAAGLPSYWDIYRQSPYATDNATYTPTYELDFKSKCNCMFYVYVTLSAMAFTIILFTAGAIIKSLLKHMTQIKKNNEGLVNTRISAHISAARTVTSLLLLYVIFYGAQTVIFTKTQDVWSVIFIASFILVSSFPTANAIILIFGNRKLSNKLRYVLGVKSSSSDTKVSVIL
ncbi:taste receptor type 2 member 40-like [Phyllobates terribilis]|uniref:taste receptor type 2 member 40-like n=1 Tax=Phyllobates terribilis TaxID=111132 RepID=UPI003CCB4283